MQSTTNGKLKIAILGGSGMLGSDLVKFLGEQYQTVSIDRKNYASHCGESFDVLINANGNSRRFWANQNPLLDFEASTVSVAKSLFDFHCKKYIYISSPDIYENPRSPATTREDSPGRVISLSPYGFHKRLGEQLVERYAKNFFILRSAAILGTKLKKGLAYDVMNGNELFVTLDSKLQFISSRAIAEIITVLLVKNANRDVFNVGGRGVVTPKTIGVVAGREVSARHDAEKQTYEMDVEKIAGLYDSLKTSEEYIRVFVQEATIK